MQDPSVRILFAGTDNHQAAAGLVKHVREEIEKPTAAVFITHEHLATWARVDTIEMLAEEDERFEIACVTHLASDALQAQWQMRQALDSHQDVNAIICVDGFSSRTAAKALEIYPGGELYYTACFDTSEEILHALSKGVIDVIAVQDYSGMGRSAIQGISQHQEGDLPREFLTRCLYYTREDAGLLMEDGI